MGFWRLWFSPACRESRRSLKDEAAKLNVGGAELLFILVLVVVLLCKY